MLADSSKEHTSELLAWLSTSPQDSSTDEQDTQHSGTHVIGIYVCVIPLQAIIQYSNNNSFACDALLPNWYHVKIQLGKSCGHPSVLLVKKNKYTLVKLWFFLLNQKLKAIFLFSLGKKKKQLGKMKIQSWEYEPNNPSMLLF